LPIYMDDEDSALGPNVSFIKESFVIIT
jgi:hypothetical protein